MKKKVVVGLSGGVDSSVAAALLLDAGYDVTGLFMVNWHDTTGTLSGDCPWEEDRLLADMVARRLDIPLVTVDLSEQYRRRVVDYMFAEYGRGRTPNPDVLCNREIKFDVFVREARRLGADCVATGHYCRCERATAADGRPVWRLLAGVDPGKDQSYFLCQLSQEQLSEAVFPVGGLLKSEVRRIAAERRLATAARKDSQGICFVGKVDLPVFLQQKLSARSGRIIEIPPDWPGYGAAARGEPLPDESGRVVRTVNPAGTARSGPNASAAQRAEPDRGASAGSEKLADVGSEKLALAESEKLAAPYKYAPSDGREVGCHEGAHFYTVGQRKGLGVGGRAEPLFVLATDVERNIVYVGQGADHPGLYRRGLRIRPGDVHWVRPDRALPPGGSGRFMVRIRYRQPLQRATLIMDAFGGGFIMFDTPQRGITPGQFAAWYEGDELLGSGVIDG